MKSLINTHIMAIHFEKSGLKQDKRLLEYYTTGKYKGYIKDNEKQHKLAGKTHLTFSNGKKEIFATGQFREEALAKAFDRIDKYHTM